ncbi:MAG: nuclear transport factor 2 family protein [Ignavibacteriales bacterium]|nr:nuclear transport factor 2 family protein [Ignavibacteriales bacterium]
MKILLLLFLLFSFSIISNAQSSTNSDLYNTLRDKDSLLFSIGFNTCDISQFDSLISENFEFYHDKAGITGTKAAFIASIRDGLCKMPYKPRRELVKGSLTVYPLEHNGMLYGAVQNGSHSFYAIEAGRPKRLTSVAKFTHLWLIQNGTWKLSRAISFDHLEK